MYVKQSNKETKKKKDIHIVMLTQPTEILIQFLNPLFMSLHAFPLKSFM